MSQRPREAPAERQRGRAVSSLLPLPVLLPMLGAALSIVGSRWAVLQRAVGVAVLAAVAVLAGMLLVAADQRGPIVAEIGGWPAPVGIALVADRLSALLLLVSTLVTLAVLVYAIDQRIVDYGRGTASTTFHPMYLMLCAGVSLAYLTGDLFTLFVAFELMLTASYVLITRRTGANRIRAGMTYVTVSLLSSLLFLTAIAMVYAATGTVNLADLAARVGELPPGLQTLLFPREEPWTLMLVLSVATMLVGVLGALAQNDLNRLLSFLLVSHIGFLLYGLAVFDAAGVSGATLYAAHHITVLATLFLVSGLIPRRTGTVALDQMGGLARTAPGLAVLFAIPALTLAGIPPTAGFVAKLALLEGGGGAGVSTAVVAGVVVATSLLT